MNFFDKHKNMVDNFNRYFNMVKNIGIGATAIASFFTTLLENEKISNFLVSKFGFLSEVFEFLSKEKYIIYVSFVILLVLTLFKFIYNAIMAKVEGMNRMSELLYMIHVDFVHDIRSKIVETDVYLTERLRNAEKTNETIDDIYNDELEKLKDNIQPYVDVLGKYLTSYRNKKISVCVKTFLNGKTNKSDYMNEELITIARSANTKKLRSSSHHSYVKNNTDFIDLCCGQSSFFGRANLRRLSDEGLYKNDTPKWWKKYNSTLVTPIRYYNKDKKNKNVNIDIDVIGFLCIDCKDNVYEWEHSDSFEVQLLAIIADSLYTYIRVFYNCFENVGYFDLVKEVS